MNEGSGGGKVNCFITRVKEAFLRMGRAGLKKVHSLI